MWKKVYHFQLIYWGQNLSILLNLSPKLKQRISPLHEIYSSLAFESGYSHKQVTAGALENDSKKEF